jgi:hypothetical protein
MVIPAEASTLTVVDAAVLAVIACDRNADAPAIPIVTIGAAENAPAGQAKVTFPEPSVTPVARSTCGVGGL